MKKNISINISGIIFHIEEDGYDQLKNYLDSIDRYFSSFEDNKEIVADIENRIAEIFLTKINDSKQVITSEDVISLIATMGSISDFQAIEDESDKSYSEEKSTFKEPTTGYNVNTKKLFRNSKRKILGGVAAGLADYLMIDPLWIRLLFLAMFFGVFFVAPISGFAAIAYFILWMVLPETDLPEDDEMVKKLYRNPDERVISGVCGGIAAYFSADVTLLRIIFVVGIFLGGATIVLYIILLVITPEAVTITDKMKMQGEPVTLSNIEQNIKKNFNVKEGEEENTLTKILLFPFRLIALVFNAGGLRIIIGAFLVFIPLIIIISILGAVATVFGAVSRMTVWRVENYTFPFELVLDGLPKHLIVAVLLIAIIPIFSILLSGVFLLTKKKIFHSAVGWSIGGVFIISLIVVAFSVPQYLMNYKKEGKWVVERTYSIPHKTLILKGNDNDVSDYSEVELYLRGYEGNDIKIIERYRSRGASKSEAIKNAQQIGYYYTQHDSVFNFDWGFHFKDEAEFRGQQLNITMYIPYGKEFHIAEDLGEILRSHNFFGSHEVEGNTWVFQRDELRCLTCPDDHSHFNYEYEHDDDFNFYNDGDDHSYNLPKGIIQAEKYQSMHGIRRERTNDVGGGKNIGYIDTGDWMMYRINVPQDGYYTVRYRVASQHGQGVIRLESIGKSYGMIDVPQTHNWQNWKTISHLVKLNKGVQEITIFAEEGGFNLNWISIFEEGTEEAVEHLWKKKQDTENINPGFNQETKNNKENTDPKTTIKKYQITDFTGLSISGFFLIEIVRGNNYKASLCKADDVFKKIKV